MLQPKKTKFRKLQKTRKILKAKLNFYSSKKLIFGKSGFIITESGVITAKQIESIRRSLMNFFKRQGKIWLRIYPHRPFTKKPIEVRMGKGKGDVREWGCFVKPGQVLLEIDGISLILIKKVFHRIQVRCPVKLKLIND